MVEYKNFVVKKPCYTILLADNMKLPAIFYAFVEISLVCVIETTHGEDDDEMISLCLMS